MQPFRSSAWVLLSVVLIALCPDVFGSTAPLSGLTPKSLLGDRVEARLKRNVEFWLQVYSSYSSREGLLHDGRFIDIIYEVGPASRVSAMRERWRQVLLSLHQKEKASPGGIPHHLSADEKRVWDLFIAVQEPDRFLRAAQRRRLRFQQGQRESFEQGIVESGKYLPYMEDIFAREGLPLELTRLPFVESSFNLRARSKVGASGIWQFIRSTGELYLRIDDAVDERNDPIRATEAAAKLLKQNYQSLKSWPLAVTAYNHGRLGLMRAVRSVGSEDFADVVDQYKSRSFGFASSNFFSCLLAAISIDAAPERYLGKRPERAPKLEFVEIELPHYVAWGDLLSFLKLERKALRELNPGLTDEVVAPRGARLLVPAGYRLRLPVAPGSSLSADAERRVYRASYDLIPAVFKHRKQPL